MAKQHTVTIRLARPVEDGPRVVDAVTIKGDTGQAQFPITANAAGSEIDMLAVQRVIAGRTGLSEVAISRLSGLDFFGLCLVLFIVTPQLPSTLAPKKR